MLRLFPAGGRRVSWAMVGAALAVGTGAWAQTAPSASVVPEAAITAEALRGHVSFLASDALEGRNSPSAGLDVAAEYIASRFRALGLKPMGDQEYFQTAQWTRSQANPAGFRLVLEAGGERHEVAYPDVVMEATPAVSLDRVATVRLTLDAAVAAPDEALRGQALLINLPPIDRAVGQRYRRLRARLLRLSPAAVVFLGEGAVPASRGGATLRSVTDMPLLPIVVVRKPELAKLPESALAVRAADAATGGGDGDAGADAQRGRAAGRDRLEGRGADRERALRPSGDGADGRGPRLQRSERQRERRGGRDRDGRGIGEAAAAAPERPVSDVLRGREGGSWGPITTCAIRWCRWRRRLPT